MNLSRIVSRFFTLLLAVVLFGAFSFDAEARRLGGGKSAGRQSSHVTQRETARTPPAAPANQPGQNAAAGAGTAGAAAAATRKPWGAMLGGLAAGLGLAWLANALGFGEAFGNVLLLILLAVVVMTIIGMVRRRGAAVRAQAGGMAYQGAGAGAANPVTPRQYNPTKVGNDASARPWENQAAPFSGTGAAAAGGGSMIGSALAGSQNWGIPAGFDIQGFTEAAKRNFVTLQDAWDRADIPALRAMMTDEMLAEIKSQLAERERTATPGQVNKTEVVMLEAQLLGMEELADEYMASVEFSGMLREDDAGPSPFREAWNMTKPKNSPGGWLVAGVQALQ
ncbi:MAG: Tim44-like domain-containing protein [Comamonadaceae bacterium]|nr:Tim44-like domain-containing protein [Comamonadaceae bacterium]